MSLQIARRKGTTAQHETFTGIQGELTVDTTKKTVVVHDGTTAGGNPLATSAEMTSAIEEAFDALTAADVPTSDESTVQAKLTSYADTLSGHTTTLGTHTSQLAEKANQTDLTISFGSFNPYDNVQIVPVISWESGEIAIATGENTANANRARTQDYIYLSAGESLIVTNASEMSGVYVIKYNTDKTWKGNSGGYLRRYTASANEYVKCVTRYTDLRVITDFSALASLLEISRNKLSSGLSKYAFEGRFPINSWELGAILVTDGQEDATSESARVRTRRFFCKRGAIVVSELSTSTFPGIYVFLYDLAGSFLGTSGGYVTSYAVSQECYVRIVSKYTDERNISNFSDFKDVIFLIQSSEAETQIPVFGDVHRLYESDAIAGMQAGESVVLASTTHANIYGKYDELLSANPNVITKTTLGYATGADGLANEDYPIYEYVFAPPGTEDPLPDYTLSVLVISGVHGDEKVSAWALYEFFKQMLVNAEDSVMQTFAANVRFKIIPCVNPGGYTANTRNNLHGVDVNRNFSYLWASADGAKGAAPYSEFESQIVRDWLSDNQSGSFAFIDFHNTGEAYGTSYLNTPNAVLSPGYSMMMRRLSVYWNKKFSRTTNKAYGWVTNDQLPVTFQDAYHVNEIDKSAILEIAWDYDGVFGTSQTLERGVEILSGYLQTLLKLKS